MSLGAITGGQWTVDSTNKYGADSIGWFLNIDHEYTQLGRTPCQQSAKQRMLMECKGQAAEYNLLLLPRERKETERTPSPR